MGPIIVAIMFISVLVFVYKIIELFKTKGDKK